MSTSASSMPQPEPRPKGEFRQNVIRFMHLLYEIGNEETRAAAFLFENTHCYMEPTQFKRLTLDEFCKGRKHRDGSRYTPGARFSKRNNALRTLNKLEADGHAESQFDESDKARKMKFYRLKLPSLDQTVIESDNTLPSTVIDFDNSAKRRAIKKAEDVIESDNGCYQTGEQGVIESDNSIRVSTREVLKGSTFIVAECETVELASIAPLARSSEEEQWLKNERKRLEGELRALEAINPRTLEHREQIDLRIKLRIAQRALDELPLSDSPAQADAPTPPAAIEQASSIVEPPGAWLPENEITIATRPPALFEEAVPPPKVSFEKEVGSWFYDWSHIDAANRQRVNIALGKLKTQGYDTLEDIRIAYERWRYGRAATLQRAGIMDFANHAAGI